MIEKFSNVQEIKDTAKYYVKLLGLQDWLIYFELTDELSNDEYAGENECHFCNKMSTIRIRKTITSELIFKQPQELVLIHELLHCKFVMLDNNSYDGLALYAYQHQLLDDMARAIFNARYNLTNYDYYL